MARTRRLIAIIALLGTAACATDGPLAPRIAPEPANLQANADGPPAPDAPATRGAVLRTYCGGPRADGPPPVYVVDGREVAYGPRAWNGLVIITTRAAQAPSR